MLIKLFYIFFFLLQNNKASYADMMKKAAGAMAGAVGGSDPRNPNKASLEGHTGKFFAINNIPTIEMPNFENKANVEKNNWSNMFFMDMPVEDEQYSAQITGNPNAYVQNTPLIYPNAYATGMYPPII